MGFIELIIAVKNAHSIYSITNKYFIDTTQKLMNYIGANELSSAIRTLNDIPQSSNPVHEMHSVITQLRLAMEAFHESNERKSQTALLIAICYKIIGDDVLSNRYKNLSIDYFDHTAYLHQQNATLQFLSKDGWYAARSMGKTIPMFFNSHLENEYGIQWTGPGPESLGYRLVSLFKEKSYNELFRDGVESAKRQYRQKINNL